MTELLGQANAPTAAADRAFALSEDVLAERLAHVFGDLDEVAPGQIQFQFRIDRHHRQGSAMSLRLPSAPSLQQDFTIAFSGDPALDLPDPGGAGNDKPERERREKERSRLLELARDTGNWAQICKAGETPTMFRIRSIHPELTFLEGERERGELSWAEWCELALRYALVGVHGLEGFKVRREPDPHDDTTEGRKRTRVTAECMSELKSIGIDAGDPELAKMGHYLIAELGGIALQRAYEGISPKR